ncbi:MAG: ABC transporter substrate-binding protein [Myxococcota bacterium]|nr:ABC transporter substrate-binding protein [Myxococcota bacterium]
MIKKPWSVSIAALVVLLFNSGCSPDLTCEDNWCGTVVITSGRVRNLVPPLAAYDVDIAISNHIYSKLADVGAELNTVGDAGFTPNLAESWRFEDPLTLAFTLASNAHWHDGTPVTASDVEFTFSIYRDQNVNSLFRSRLDAISSVTVRDSLTVLFHFSEQYAEQFFDAVYHMHILPRHILESVPPGELRTHSFGLNPIGSGPYRMVRWEPGELVELAADSTHHLGKPSIRRVIWQAAAGPTPAINPLIGNTADFHHNVAEASDIPRVEDTDHLRLIDYPSNVYNYIGFNLRNPDDQESPHALFSNRELRRAITMAIDRVSLREAIVGANGLPSVGPVTPALWIFDENLVDALPYDAERALATLESLGWRDSNDDGTLDRAGQDLAFTLLVPEISVRTRAAVILQNQLQGAGIRIDIEEVEFASFIDRLSNGQFDAHYNGIGQDPSPSGMADNWSQKGFGGFNYGRYSNPEFERLTAEAKGTTDRAAALAKWHEALRVINEDAPAIWLYVPRLNAAVHTRIENVSVRPGNPWMTVPQWRIPPGNFIERDLFGSQ